MEVAKSKQGITISQMKYVLDLHKETRMTCCKFVGTPIDPNNKLGSDFDGSLVDKGISRGW